MKTIGTFEKHGFEIEVAVTKKQAFLIIDGQQVKTEAMQHMKHGWYFTMNNKEIAKKMGSKTGGMNLLSELASEVKPAMEKMANEEETIKFIKSWSTGIFAADGESELLKKASKALKHSDILEAIEKDFEKVSDETFEIVLTKDEVEKAVALFEQKRETAKTKEQKSFDIKLAEAKKENKDVELYHYHIDCTDENEDCDLDIVTVYITPSGNTRKVIAHTW